MGLRITLTTRVSKGLVFIRADANASLVRRYWKITFVWRMVNRVCHMPQVLTHGYFLRKMMSRSLKWFKSQKMEVSRN